MKSVPKAVACNPKETRRQGPILWLCLVYSFLMCWNVGIGGQSDPPRATGDTRLSEKDAADRRTADFGRSLVKVRQPAQMTDLTYAQLPKEIRSQLWSDLGLVLRKQARPQALGDPLAVKEELASRVRVYAARDRDEDDLVEYRWT